MALTKVLDAGLNTPASDLQDNEKIVLGTGNDLQLYHDGTDSIISNATNVLKTHSSHLYIRNAAGNEDLAKFIQDGACELYHDNSKKFETTSVGVKVTGNYQAVDGYHIYMGTGNDLDIYHDGSDSYIDDAGTGSILIRSDTHVRINKQSAAESMATFTPDGAVELYYDAVKKFETTADGVQVTGKIFSSSHLDFADDVKLLLGTGDDLEIFHDGTINWIDSVNNHAMKVSAGTGNLFLQGANVRIGVEGQAEYCAKFIADGAVELYHDNSKKLETTSDGATITGDLTINDGTPHVLLVDTNDSNSTGSIAHTSGNLKLKADDNQAMGSSSIMFLVDGSEKARILTGGGMTFNGDTAAANALDDYEEGTFTAVPQNSVTLHGTIEDCFYTKIGRLVHLQGQIRVDSDNSGADLRIGIPFTADNGPDSSGHAIGAVRTHTHDYTSDTSYGVLCIIADGWDEMRFQYNKDNAANENIDAQSDAYYGFAITYTAA